MGQNRQTEAPGSRHYRELALDPRLPDVRRGSICLLTPIPSPVLWSCEVKTSTCRSFATISPACEPSSGLVSSGEQRP